jgi:hypothetical protein
MGLFNAPNPVQWIESIRDDNLKRAAAQTAMSVAYSQWITFLYEFGTAIGPRRFIGFLGPVFVRMAASAYTLLQNQRAEKLIDLAVPKALVDDSKLNDSIYWEEISQK